MRTLATEYTAGTEELSINGSCFLLKKKKSLWLWGPTRGQVTFFLIWVLVARDTQFVQIQQTVHFENIVVKHA